MLTTLNKIRAKRPCTNGWEKLLRHLGKTQADDECVFRPIMTARSGNVTGDFGIVTDRSGIVTAGVLRV